MNRVRDVAAEMASQQMLDPEEELFAAERALGESVLAGNEPDHSAVNRARARIEALRAGEAETARRLRADADAAFIRRNATLRAQYEREQTLYLARIGLAEQSARELAGHIRAAMGHADLMRAGAAGRRGSTATGLESSEIARRLGERLSLLLRNIVHPLRFGNVRLHTGALDVSASAMTESWVETERRAIGADTPEKELAA